MTEENISIFAGELCLEGLLEDLPGDKGVVVTHPHPLYGGDMHNNVVEILCRAYREKGYSTLRFNFRGVGQSEGEYDNGVGEQKDVRAALEYLSGLGKTEIDLAGYSFGAWVNALGLKRYDLVRRMIMVSPPVGFIDFSFLSYNPKIRLVIAGTEDDIAGLKGIKKGLPAWNPEADLRVINGADHFYEGKTDELFRIICHFLEIK
ncbi:MAG: alpha/beta hydrolase [Deltaproteobacteria bacterium]|nr:alpha/beta hydrolase [Deltaproteobacteria bacterium]